LTKQNGKILTIKSIVQYGNFVAY